MPRNFSLTAKLTEDQEHGVKVLAERADVTPSEWNRRLVERELAGHPDRWYIAAELAAMQGFMMAIAKALGVDPAVIRDARKAADRAKLETARKRWLEFRDGVVAAQAAAIGRAVGTTAETEGGLTDTPEDEE